MTISKDEIERHKSQIRNYSNSGKYQRAYDLASRLHRQHPKILDFAYYEAVFTAEEFRGISKSELNVRYRKAASKLRKLLRKLNGVEPRLKRSVRNEYYWFSRQPYKQYRLGIEFVNKGDLSAYYSQGVGAVEVAREYAKKRSKTLFLKWAKTSEKAWLEYFKVQANWFNSYLFYATALGFQGRKNEMYAALKRGSKISGISLKDEMFTSVVKDVAQVLAALDQTA